MLGNPIDPDDIEDPSPDLVEEFERENETLYDEKWKRIPEADIIYKIECLDYENELAIKLKARMKPIIERMKMCLPVKYRNGNLSLVPIEEIIKLWWGS